MWTTELHVIARVSRLELTSAKGMYNYRFQAEKEELVALKNSAPEVDADEESRARLAALRGEDAGPKKAVDLPFRTAQVRAFQCVPEVHSSNRCYLHPQSTPLPVVKSTLTRRLPTSAWSILLQAELAELEQRQQQQDGAQRSADGVAAADAGDADAGRQEGGAAAGGADSSDSEPDQVQLPLGV
jgi:hypothetical protein